MSVQKFFREKSRVLAWGGVLILSLVAAAFWFTQDNRQELATIQKLNDAQTIWYTQPMLNYHIVVDVRRPDEWRRNELTVQDGKIVRATVKYRHANGFWWETPYDLNEDQDYPFTIPGLYDMLRGAINNSNRAEIRVDMRGDPPFPHLIVFGPVWDAGSPVWGTESRVIVREFEEIP